MKKTVYFLGAGFSADAGGPTQNGIIKNILEKDFNEENKAKDAFLKFLTDQLCIPAEHHEHVELEDVFTPIDRCIADHLSFNELNCAKLEKLKEQFQRLMAASIKYGVDKKSQLRHQDQDHIKKFAKYVNSIAKRRLKDPEKDEIALITTNWDIMLDNCLHNILENENHLDNSFPVLDYCCYAYPLDEYYRSNFVPGLLALGRKSYNIKYLKLHGSLNWLHCPKCQRVYVSFGEKSYFDTTQNCRECGKIGGLHQNISLKGNLLVPTFLKDLNDVQTKLIWQNAAIELSEADKIVFIGYSLPAADFEIRQLLSRSVPKNADIEVILYPGKPNDEENKKRIDQEKGRYRYFFGTRINDNSFITKNVSDYVNRLPEPTSSQ